MLSFEWLSSGPPQLSLLSASAVLLLAGSLTLKALVSRLRLPEATALTLCGMALGPTGLGLIDPSKVPGLAVLADLCIGLVLFELGHRFDWRWLVLERAALRTSIAQALGVFFACLILLLVMDHSFALSMLIAAALSTSSPVIGLRASQELRSEGQVTERLLHSLVVHCVVGFTLLLIAIQLLHMTQSESIASTVIESLYWVIGSAMVGFLLARIVQWAAAHLGPQPGIHLLLVLGVVAFLVELSGALELSALIALLVFGIASKGKGRRIRVKGLEDPSLRLIAFAFVFIYLGLAIPVEWSIELLGIALALLGLRFTVLCLIGSTTYRANRLPLHNSLAWSLAATPIAGVSVLLLGEVDRLYPLVQPSLNGIIGPVLLASLTAGPFLVRWGLRHTGETAPHD